MNMGEIEYHMKEVQKINRKQIGMDNKMVHFRWISSFIAANGENTVWVEGDSGVTSLKIEKNTLNFEPEAWYTLA